MKRLIVVAATVAALAVTSVATGAADDLVRSGDIRQENVRNADLGTNAVDDRVLGDKSVDFEALDDALRRLFDGPVGSPRTTQGPKGDTGPPGPQGEQGPAGASGHEVVTSGELDFGPGGYGGWSCPEGKVVTGGGYRVHDDADLSNGVAVTTSAPLQPGDDWPHYNAGPDEYGWVIQVNKPDAVDPGDIEVFAICVDMPAGDG